VSCPSSKEEFRSRVAGPTVCGPLGPPGMWAREFILRVFLGSFAFCFLQK
jgi:hypothetical protein